MSVGFLSDLLQTIAERGRGVIERAWPSAVGASERPHTANQLLALCDALLSRRGEASGVAIAGAILDGYAMFGEAERIEILDALERRYGPDERAVSRAVDAYQAAPGGDNLKRLQQAVEPRRQELIRRLNLAAHGTAALVKMREDLLRLGKGEDRWPGLDADFTHLLASWFNRGFLVMRRIGWSTPANILELIIRYEAVHEIRDWDDLRRRIEPDDRRLFGFFHPQLVDEPLIFVEVALTRDIPDSIGALLTDRRDVIRARDATTAVFYSISNCQEGLRGISFGHFLIKQVADDLKRELPDLETFVTLSPIVGAAKWLKASEDPNDQALAGRASEPDWLGDATVAERLRPAMLAAGARYLAQAKRSDGRPIDPVARFHLGNGAVLERVNWPADRSPGALKSAFGLMVNYRYDLGAIEQNHENYAERNEVAISSAVKRLLTRRPPSPLPAPATTGQDA